MEAQTFFLGVIAICMVIITIGMIGISIAMFSILKVLAQLLYRVNVDYQALSPKIHRIVDNLEYSTSLIGFVNMFRKRKR
ncbi:MAG: hypothetical protein GXO21_06060 [Aquificae bacterium]|nr:hypothetical protein [Aquificota bacterium]